MDVLDVAEKFKAIFDIHGNIPVFYSGERGGPFAITDIKFVEVKSDDEYPEDFHMPKGFKFILVS